jgi:hypothetical protein
VTASASSANTVSTPPGGLALSCAMLLAVMLTSTLLVACWLQVRHGNEGLYSALVGSLVCTLPALMALIVSASFADTPHSLAANLGVMLIRMGAPLVGLTVLPGELPALAASGLSTAILALYLVALLSETLLALRHVRKQLPKSATALATSTSTQPVEAR